MELNDVLAYVSTLGLGGLIGATIKVLIDRNQQNRKMLFEARVKAYTGIMGRISNHFLELDISRESKGLRFAQINGLLSETYLVGSKTLSKKLDQYVKALHEFHDVLAREARKGTTSGEREADQKRKEVTTLAIAVQDQMRKDLFLKVANDPEKPGMI